MPVNIRIKTALRCSVMGAALLVSNYAFAAGEGPTIVDRWVDEAKSYSFFDLSYQGVSYDEATDVTSVSGLKAVFTPDFTSLVPDGEDVPTISYVIEVPSLRYFALSENADRYFVDSIVADEVNVTYSVEGGTTDVQNTEANGTYDVLVIAAADWSKLPDIADDPAKPISKYYPLVAAFFDMNMASFNVAGSELSQTLDTKTLLNTTYGAIEFNDMKRGDYSAFSIDGIKMVSAPQSSADTGDAAFELLLEIARLDGGAYNGGTMVRQFDPSLPSSQRNTPFKTLLGSLAVTGTKLDVDDVASVSLDAMSYSDWGVRPPSIPLLSLADELYLEAKEAGSEPDEMTILRFVSSFYSMFRIGSFDITGFDIDVNDTENGTEFAAQLDSFRLADLWSVGLGELSFKGFFAEGEGNRIQMDLFQLKDIGFPTLAALMDAERASDEKDVKAIIAALPTLGLIEASGIDVSIKDKPGFKLGLNRLEMGNFIGRLPTRVSSTLENLEFNVADLEAEGREVFEKMGYERVNLSYVLSLIWDEASEILSLESRNALDDGGTLNAAVEIGSVPRSVFEDPETAQNALAFLTFNAASMVFNDNSIVDRALEAAASEQGKSADQLKQELLGALPFLMSALNKPDFVDEVAKAVSQLLSEGGSLTATAQPDQPVSVMQVIAGGAAAPGTLVDLLKVEVIAE
ncbi:hypothetical protein [Pararhizobium sp. IMCC21322]|uniref:hypothetical protein n=1 Tax=Pararhizobium sp. IMCC21322 TaxID=3067903 RepID=UPI00274080A3|nr:hypothetical protein [Pararhizobium sp. IMCC21322]